MEFDEESDSAPSGKKRCIEQAEVEKQSSHDASQKSEKKRHYERTNFTDIVAYLSLRQFPAHIDWYGQKQKSELQARLQEIHVARWETNDAMEAALCEVCVVCERAQAASRGLPRRAR